MTLSDPEDQAVRTMSVSQFRANASRETERVASSREGVILTRRGRPVAQVLPYMPEKAEPDRLAHTLIYMGDIVSPLEAEMWEAAR